MWAAGGEDGSSCPARLAGAGGRGRGRGRALRGARWGRAARLRAARPQVKVWFQNRRMKWRHSKEAQAQKDKEPPPEPEPAAQRAGAAPAAPGEPERSPSRSDGDSDSSDAESLDMAPSDTERTEGAERSLPAAGLSQCSGSPGLPSPPPAAASPEPRSGL